jgi:hypothetical protein
MYLGSGPTITVGTPSVASSQGRAAHLEQLAHHISVGDRYVPVQMKLVALSSRRQLVAILRKSLENGVV